VHQRRGAQGEPATASPQVPLGQPVQFSVQLGEKFIAGGEVVALYPAEKVVEGHEGKMGKMGEMGQMGR
jgi:hypothetical protein